MAYPMFNRVQMEVPYDPHWKFWRDHDTADPNGDPLDLLIRAEEGDEVAQHIMSGLSRTARA